MLQDERGFRVQLMKDTTKPNEYSILENVRLQQGVDGSGNALPIQDPSDATKLRISTGSDGGNTVKRLRKGLQIVEVETVLLLPRIFLALTLQLQILRHLLLTLPLPQLL